MAAGKVSTLIMLGGNPVYDAPADLDFAAALKPVKTSIHLHEQRNETSVLSAWHVPRAHFLEAWGDVRTWDGTITIAQPLIAPLYGGLSAIELARAAPAREGPAAGPRHEGRRAAGSNGTDSRGRHSSRRGSRPVARPPLTPASRPAAL
jgi:molybdopterin-containing oxidoreductase family iron-sulfur binding subunit